MIVNMTNIHLIHEQTLIKEYEGKIFFNFSISDSPMFGLCIRILLFNSCPKRFGVVLNP